MSGDGRQRVESIQRALDEAREKLVDYDPPWLEPGFESLRIDIDRQLRSVQLALTNLASDIGRAPTDPPAEKN